jgi:tetratricopeptide (TPR) repeat protein
MPNANELKAALERLIAGTASEADVNALRNALTSGVLVTGGRAVALGGNATDVSIATGDHIEFSIRGGEAATVLAALNSITPTRLHQVPPPPADFTGRVDELRELLAAIKQGGVTISGLQGMGGIGKTALAFKLIEQLKPHYPDAQIYLDLKGASTQPLNAAEALAHVIRSYLPAAKLPDSETDLHALYLSVLEGQRALILMDNAFDAKQVEPLIPPASCVLLVTSRWYFILPGLAAKSLDALTATDARALLLRIAPRIGEWADEIAKLCGYLPQAVRLAAGALAKYINLKPADYVQHLQDRQQRLQLIDASLSVSYELLSEELKKRWCRLAVFPDSFADDAAAAVWEVKTEQAQHTLGELIAASMVEWTERVNRYRLHDLSQLFADSKLSEEELNVAHKRHAIHYKDVLTTAKELYKEGGGALRRGLAFFDLEWGNIQAAHAWVAARGVEAEEDVAHLAMTYPNAGIYVLDLRLHAREWIHWLELSLAAARRLKDRRYQGNALGSLGIAFWKLGENRRAIQFHEQYLAISREFGDRKGEGNALGNLGNAYRDLNETKRAIQLYEQALIIACEIGDRRSEGNGLGSLGLAYTQLGETQRAIQFYEQALIIAREIGDRRGEGNGLSGLGLAYAQLGENHRAMQFYEQQLIIVREIGDRKGEGDALWSMSLALDELGERAQAIQHAELSLAIHDQIDDPYAEQVRAQLAAWREESGHN